MGPANAKDNSQSGVTGNVYIDAYRLDGTRLWRINLGRNIRAGAHYTQFQVYDYDGDGRAEVAMKTADGTVDGTGQVIGNASADYRNSSGYVLTGPEYLTMFNGLTGAAMSTVNYEPAARHRLRLGRQLRQPRRPVPRRHRLPRRAAPSLIMARGYYTRTVIVAWDFRNGSADPALDVRLQQRRQQQYDRAGQPPAVRRRRRRRRHATRSSTAPWPSTTTAPALWNTGYGHGDALHVGDLDPGRPGLEVFKVDEHSRQPAVVDARRQHRRRSSVEHARCSCDNGRGVAGDIYAGSAGAESWSRPRSAACRNATGRQRRAASPARRTSSPGGTATRSGNCSTAPTSTSTAPAATPACSPASGVHSNNGTKSTPSLSGDLFGDWREEIDLAAPPTTPRCGSTPRPTTTDTGGSSPCMHDPQYRVAIAWQNTAYNQPPHPSFFLGDGMSTPPAAQHLRPLILTPAGPSTEPAGRPARHCTPGPRTRAIRRRLRSSHAHA